MKRRLDTFAKVLNQAADRVYLRSVWLGDDLERDGARTLHDLSVTPQAFGALKPCHDDEARRLRLQDLLTAARAYVVAKRKTNAHAIDQPELKLPEPKPKRS